MPREGIDFQAEERDVGELTLALGRAGVGILALAPELATLEDLFFRLTEGAADGRGPDAGEDGRRRARAGERAVSSVAAAPPLPIDEPRRARRPSTLTVYRWELRKLVSQKRTYLGLRARLRRCR